MQIIVTVSFLQQSSSGEICLANITQTVLSQMTNLKVKMVYLLVSCNVSFNQSQPLFIYFLMFEDISYYAFFCGIN